MTQSNAESLLAMHGDLVFQLCRRLAGTESEDLFQETFLRLLVMPEVDMDAD